MCKGEKISALVTIPSLAQGLFTLLIAVVMGIYYSWKMGLVASLFIPVLLVGIILQQKIITGEDSIEKAAFEKSAQVWLCGFLSGFLVKNVGWRSRQSSCFTFCFVQLFIAGFSLFQKYKDTLR